MSLRRALIVALLAYLTLDLSLPMMPGAFVFDVSDSVDGIQSHAGRPTSALVVPSAPARGPFVTSPRRMAMHERLAPARAIAVPCAPLVRVRPPAAPDTAPPPSEDPH